MPLTRFQVSLIEKNRVIHTRSASADTVETSDHNGAQMKRPAPRRYDEKLKPPCDDSSAGVRQAVGDILERHPSATSLSAEIAARCFCPQRLCSRRNVKSITRLHKHHHPGPLYSPRND